MNFKYFDFSFYKDSTNELEKLFNSDDPTFFVFIRKSEWNSANKELLFKILKALDLDLEQHVSITLLDEKESAFYTESLLTEMKYKFLAFGLNSNRLGLQIKTIPYSIIELSNVRLIFAHSLSDISSNIDLKKRLWTLLKQF